MMARIVLSVVVGVVVALACLLIGALLITFAISWAVAIGEWLKTYNALLGLLAALWYFFGGGFNSIRPAQ